MMKIALVAIMLFSALALVACGSSAPASFYLLQARTAASFEGPETAAAEELSIGIGPLELPEYLDRPQMVVRSGTNSVEIREFERWAEPLEEGVSRVLTDSLADLLRHQQIAIYSWRSQLQVDYRLGLTLTRFEGAASGRITLAGVWALYDTEKRKIAIRKTFFLSHTAESQEIEALVDGQSQLLAELSEGIANSVIEVVAIRENPPVQSGGDGNQ